MADVFTETLISSDHIVFCLDVISEETGCGINIPPESPIMICHLQTLPDLRRGLFPTTMPKSILRYVGIALGQALITCCGLPSSIAFLSLHYCHFFLQIYCLLLLLLPL